MQTTSLRERLLELMAASRAGLQAMVASLNEAERIAGGTLEHWAPKDIVAHIAYWQHNQALRLAAALRGETPPDFDNFLELNDQAFGEYRRRSWPEVLKFADDAHRELAALLRGFPDEALSDPNAFQWRQGQPLWLSVAGNGYWHPQAHVAQFYLERGDVARAAQIQEEVAAATQALDDSPAARSTALYNLACFYAQSGQAPRAIPLLREAFALDPRLLDWSLQDGDLASLRELPEYQALYPATPR